MTTIFLAGATGLVGGIALTLMLDDDRVTQVVAPTRRPLAPHSKLLNPLVDSGTPAPRCAMVGGRWRDLRAGHDAQEGRVGGGFPRGRS